MHTRRTADPSPFHALGTRIAETFRRKNHVQRALPEAAARSLEAFDMPRLGELFDIVVGRNPSEWDSSQDFAPVAITVYEEASFLVQLCLWHEPSTAIRDLSFDGAFRIVQGRCVYALYEFIERDEVSESFAIGHLRPLRSEVLGPGSVRAFDGDRGLGHALLHLEFPAAALLVRSRNEVARASRYLYSPPFVGLSSPTPSRQATKGLAAWRRESPTRYQAALVRAMQRASVEQAFRLWYAYECDKSLDDIDDTLCSSVLCEVASVRFPEHASFFEACIEEARRVRLLHERLTTTSNEHHRLLLGSLSLAQDRPQLLDFVASATPGARPAKVIASLVREMIQPRNIERELRVIERGADAMYLTRLLLEEARDAFDAHLIASAHDSAASPMTAEQIDDSYARIKTASALFAGVSREEHREKH